MSRKRVMAIDILSNPRAMPSAKTVFQKVICSNFILSSVGTTIPWRPRPYGIWRTKQIHDISARACGLLKSQY